MKKSKYYLIIGIILCGVTLLLYYCRNNNPIPKKYGATNGFNTTSNTTQPTSQRNNNQNTILTNDEEHKFNILKNSFDKINYQINSMLIVDKDRLHYLNNKKDNNITLEEKQEKTRIKDHIENTQRMIDKYQDFINWILTEKQSQKEIANAFNFAYNILENKRKIYATNKTLEQYISDGINCIFNYSCNNKEYRYSKNENLYENVILIFFQDILRNITVKDTHEEILKALKENLTDTIVDSPLYILKNWNKNNK